MDLAFVDKLAGQNNGVKYFFVSVDIFSRFFRVQTMNTKYAKDTLQAFGKLFLDKTLLKNFGVIKEQTVKKFCKEKDIEVYSTMSEG